MEDREDPLLGLVLDGRYEVAERIGLGGMGIVYRARHSQANLSLAREVAIKVLTEEASKDDALVARFRNETRIISELRHPNTLKLFDFGHTADGRPYIVTELLHGTPLDRVLEGGPLGPEQTVHLLKQIAESLTEAHAKGIVHRDLKPANVFIEEVEGQEVVKVLDFGIARPNPQSTITGGGVNTNPGKAFGTPAYMSPEQARAEKVDARSDLYSLGVIAYECLSGRRPFQADTTLGILFKHMHEQPTPLVEQVPSIIPADLDALVMRLLEKEAARRPQSAAEVRKALAKLELILSTPASNGSVPTFGILTPSRPPSQVRAPLLTVTRGERRASRISPPAPMIETATVPDGAIVRITGVINESFSAGMLGHVVQDSVVIDLDGVRSITSIGIREWMIALEGLRAQHLAFIRCRPALILQFNMIEGFGKGGQIVSLYLPYTCLECDEEIQVLADLRMDYDVVSSGPKSEIECPDCRGRAEFDEVEFLSYVQSQPRPEVAASIGRLIDGGSAVEHTFTEPTAITDHPSGEPALSDRIEPGDQIGEYVVEQTIGGGDVGTVYRALHPVHQQKAAIKVLHRRLSSSQSRVDRFIAEVCEAGGLAHPNLIEVLGFGVTRGGQPYYSMEYIEGETLERALLFEKYRDPSLALLILGQIALGLEAAHERGIVHGNLKPACVMIGKGAVLVVKLLDFGVAALLSDGGSLDRRTDIYSFGVLAYEMLTGAQPFPAGSAVETPAVPSQVRASLPPAIDTVLLAALSRDPGERPSSIGEVMAGLEAALAGGDLDRRDTWTDVSTDVVLGAPPSPVEASLELPSTLRDGEAYAPARKGRLIPGAVAALLFAIAVVVLIGLGSRSCGRADSARDETPRVDRRGM